MAPMFRASRLRAVQFSAPRVSTGFLRSSRYQKRSKNFVIQTHRALQKLLSLYSECYLVYCLALLKVPMQPHIVYLAVVLARFPKYSVVKINIPRTCSYSAIGGNESLLVFPEFFHGCIRRLPKRKFFLCEGNKRLLAACARGRHREYGQIRFGRAAQGNIFRVFHREAEFRICIFLPAAGVRPYRNTLCGISQAERARRSISGAQHILLQYNTSKGNNSQGYKDFFLRRNLLHICADLSFRSEEHTS